MQIRLSLSKAEYESTLLELVSRSMQRVVKPEDVQAISLSYNPKTESAMNVVLKFNPPERQNQ